MSDLFQQLKYNYKNGNISVKLIFINVAVFVLAVILNFVFFRGNHLGIETYFGAESGIDGFFNQPWGILTYAFFHGNVLHLALNMLMIYFVGQLFLRYFRNEDFLTFYTGGIISGAIFFILFSNILNYGHLLLGASAAIYSVFFALVAYIPKTKVQFAFININIPLDYVAYALLAFDFLMILSNDNVGGHISHLGGAVFGFLYMKQFEKGNDFIGKFVRSLSFANKTKKNTSRSSTPPRDDYEFNAQKVKKQEKIDKILDKISRSGYESLSKEEKDFLFNSGRNG